MKGEWKPNAVRVPFIPHPSSFILATGKGEKVGGRKPLNVRAHQRRGDPPARQTPPGARPNRGQGRPAPLRSSGRLLEPPGNRRPRKMTVAGPQGSGQNPAYRPA